MAGRPLKLDDASRFASTLAKGAFAPAEHCFANLWLWRGVHQYRLYEEPVPHLRGVTYDGKRHALPLVDLTRGVVNALLSLDDIDCLYPLDGKAVQHAERWNCERSTNPADSDYWYAADDLAALAGAKSRRSQARAFSNQEAVDFEPWHGGLAEEAQHVLAGWATDITRPAETTDIVECREAITLARQLGLEGGVVRSDGQAVAFILASVSDEARVVHFAKGRRSHDGCYPWMFSTYADQCGGKWINFEQDLGIPGLAQSKRAYSPHHLQPKHRLRKCLHI